MAFSNIALLVCAFILCTIVAPAISCSCHLRTRPLLALSDGLLLQQNLMANRHQNFEFLPREVILKEDYLNQNKIDLISSLLSLIRLRDSLSVLKDSTTDAVLRRLMDSIIFNSCAYLADELNHNIDCNNISSIESLAAKIQMQKTLDSIFTRLQENHNSEIVGSEREKYAYWNEHVVKTCTPETCPRLKEIEKALRFRTGARRCNCP